jgi:MerR family transcriptional regulator, mercuric resistance operon regulatory protein
VSYRVKHPKEIHLDNLTIGRVAQQAGVGKETIRYYQALGLVEEPTRRQGSVRRYGPATVARLQFIKRAQRLGFTLEEVRKLLLLEDGQNCAETRKLAQHKLALIRDRIADLNRMRRALDGLVKECEEGKRPRACPIISTLSQRFP